MTYATPSELRARINKSVTTDDSVLENILAAAERNINRACNRPDGFEAGDAEARYFPGSGLPYQWIDDCAAITAVAVKDSASDDEDSYTAWTLGTLGSTTGADVFPATGDPKYPAFNRTPYSLLIIGPNGDYSLFPSGSFTSRRGFRPYSSVSRGMAIVKVTAQWGYATTVPDDIREAALMQSARWYKRFESAMADTLASGELGQLLYRQSLDPDIKRLLNDGRYVKMAVGRR